MIRDFLSIDVYHHSHRYCPSDRSQSYTLRIENLDPTRTDQSAAVLERHARDLPEALIKLRNYIDNVLLPMYGHSEFKKENDDVPNNN